MIAYALIKAIVEIGWCYAALKRFRDSSGTTLLAAGVRYGLFRVLVGRALAFLLEDQLRHLTEWAAYALVVLPLRWLCWSIVLELIATRTVRLRSLFVGHRRTGTLRLAGVALSSVADVWGLLAGVWAGSLWP